MKTLKEKYCLVHKQGFVPIFVNDSFDAVQLAQACLEAGATAIEITCRRNNVKDEIKRIRKAFPDLLIMVGSIVDDGPMLNFLKTRRPDMPSLEQLTQLDVDGFVSMMPISIGTIQKYSSTHMMVPGVETFADAVAAVQAGAHFAKFFTASNQGGPKRIALANCAAMHSLIPIFVTGGVTLDKVKPYVQAGTALLGSGWDVLLGDQYKNMQKNPDIKHLAAALKQFLDEMAESRSQFQSLNNNLQSSEYLKSLKHYMPFI